MAQHGYTKPSRKLIEKERIVWNESVVQVLILWRKKPWHKSGQFITGCCRLITGCWWLIARGRRHGHDDGVLGRSRHWKVLYYYTIHISIQHLNYWFVTISTLKSLWSMQWRIHQKRNLGGWGGRRPSPQGKRKKGKKKKKEEEEKKEKKERRELWIA